MLEQFSIRWLNRRSHAFFLGFVYSIIGILSAWLIFPSNVGFMSVAFASILLIPTLNNLLRNEEKLEIREKKFSLRLLFRDHKDIFKIYFFLFFGVFSAFFVTVLVLPLDTSAGFFNSQLDIADLSGSAVSGSKFLELIVNNILVFLVCLILSLVYGAGSIIFIVWNASVWGAVFAFAAKVSYAKPGMMLISIIPFLPHMITEAIAYISASISGGVISKAALLEKVPSKEFYHILTDALILCSVGFMLVIISGVIEVTLF